MTILSEETSRGQKDLTLNPNIKKVSLHLRCGAQKDVIGLLLLQIQPVQTEPALHQLSLAGRHNRTLHRLEHLLHRLDINPLVTAPIRVLLQSRRLLRDQVGSGNQDVLALERATSGLDELELAVRVDEDAGKVGAVQVDQSVAADHFQRNSVQFEFLAGNEVFGAAREERVFGVGHHLRLEGEVRRHGEGSASC